MLKQRRGLGGRYWLLIWISWSLDSTMNPRFVSSSNCQLCLTYSTSRAFSFSVSLIFPFLRFCHCFWYFFHINFTAGREHMRLKSPKNLPAECRSQKMKWSRTWNKNLTHEEELFQESLPTNRTRGKEKHQRGLIHYAALSRISRKTSAKSFKTT